jgi:hypothetical protein
MARMVSDDSTRQGPKGRPVLYVLIGSLVLLGVFMVAFLTWSGSTTPDSPSQAASRQSTTGDGSSTSSANTGGVPSANPAYPAPADRAANPSATGTTGNTRQ